VVVEIRCWRQSGSVGLSGFSTVVPRVALVGGWVVRLLPGWVARW